VVSLFNLVPGVDARGLLMREVDVAFLGLSLFAHYLNFVTRLYLRLAFVIKHLRKRQHTFRFRSNIDHHVRRRQLQHRAFDNPVFSHGLFGFCGEVFEGGSEVFAGVLIVGGGRWTRRFLRRSRCGSCCGSGGCNRSLILLS
jgi:hypothetical protein